MTIEDILALTVEPSESQKNGKPCDRSYLETNLSAHHQKAINDYVQGEKDKVSYMTKCARQLLKGLRITACQACFAGADDRLNIH